MNYKAIIKSRKIRMVLLRLLRWVPDKKMIEFQYGIKMGRALDLKNPQRYTEKIQWYKLNYKDQRMIQCVDKYEVREYIKQKGLGSILNECYGVYSHPDDISFSDLPDEFVVKNTLGTGGNSVILCDNKKALNITRLKKTLTMWINDRSYIKGGGREWPYYSGRKPRIIIEKYIKTEGPRGLVDYKFMCFNGKVEYCFVLCDRKLGVLVKEGVFDRNFNQLDVGEVGDEIPEGIEKPDNYEEMIVVAEKLANDFPHVRVDLYDVSGKIIFGELTFYDSSGYSIYEPDEFDYRLGSVFELPKRKKL